MSNFFPNQRYTSEGEPELGVGILTETSKGRVQIHFPVSDVTRLYAMESAPLRRVVFKPGDTIININNQSMLIERVKQEGELYTYYGQGRSVSEADLGDVTVNFGVDERLYMGDVDTPELFTLRRETLEFDHQRRISAVKGFVGGRIDLIPHQLYIAHEVSMRYAPRVLLSDQVGLGKTIEACLILHRLLLSGRISRVLILVPESLVHQWFVELLRRFNLWFNIFDKKRCDALDSSAPNGNPFLDNQLIICSTQFLAGSEKRSQQAINAPWDMLVVDEAHHLEWSVDNVSQEYAVVEQLSMVTKGLLLLTATPEQLGMESHFARLRLLDPERYANYEDFKNESHNHKNIADIVENLSTGKVLKVKETKMLASIFSQKRIDSLSKGGDLERHNLIEDLLDQHGPGRVLFRNTRSAMIGFPKRIAHLIPLIVREESKLWLKRLTNEFVHDMGVSTDASNKPQFWFETDPRVEWLLKKMKEIDSAKVLLICKSKEKVLALDHVLSKNFNIKVGVFHEDLTIIQRDRNAAWFSEPNGAQILLCSEIGSEGRNFQFAHHLVLFDLPLHPELLEQRIGRLDRIGQINDIHIYVPYLENSPQQLLVRWFHEGINAFEENLEGGNQLFKLFAHRLIDISKLETLSVVGNSLEAIIVETAKFHKELRLSLANGRDRLLEMNSFRPKIAEQLVKQIQADDSDVSLENYLTNVFQHFNMEMEDLAPRTYYLHPASATTGVFPTIPPQGISVTFDRKRALAREDISFLTWDHPMTTGAIDMVLSSGTGSASFGVMRGTGSRAILLEFLFVLETAGERGIYVDRFLPNTPLRIVIDHTCEEVTDEYPVETFDEQLMPGQIDVLLDNEQFMETVLPQMISMATTIAEYQGAQKMAEGLERMNLVLEHEINRLTLLQTKNRSIRPAEIQTAKDEKTNLTASIKDARIRLDSLQLIMKE